MGCMSQACMGVKKGGNLIEESSFIFTGRGREIWGKIRCFCPLSGVDSEFAHCWWSHIFLFANKWVRFPCLLTSFFYLLVLTSAVPVLSPGKGLDERLWVVQLLPTLPSIFSFLCQEGSGRDHMDQGEKDNYLSWQPHRWAPFFE